MAAREILDEVGMGQKYCNEIIAKVFKIGNNLGLPEKALADTLEGPPGTAVVQRRGSCGAASALGGEGHQFQQRPGRAHPNPVPARRCPTPQPSSF